MLENSPTINWKKFIYYITITIVILVISFLILGRKISATSNEIQDKKNQTEALKNREKNINQLQNNYFKIKDNISTVTKVLLDEENIADFIKYLEDLGQTTATNMQITFDDKVNAEVQKNKYLILDLNISGNGTGVQKFFQSLEKGPYLINIIFFSYDSVDGLASDSQLKLKVKVFTNDPYSLNK